MLLSIFLSNLNFNMKISLNIILVVGDLMIISEDMLWYEDSEFLRYYAFRLTKYTDAFLQVFPCWTVPH
jgi:hypothetical protein